MTELNVTDIHTLPRQRARARTLVAGTLWLLDHWLPIFLILFGLYWITPFLAPIFMKLGWSAPANLIYTIYSTQCHQMAQRSFFLFGQQPMYNADQLPIAFTADQVSTMLALRAFIGNANLGWKVAWSDRMVYMYGGVLLMGVLFGLRRRSGFVRPLRWYAFGLLLLPMLIDGVTHWLSDVTSSWASGFRYDNPWLADLTGHRLPTWFYVGDALGSFNSWMRLLTGWLFGFAVVWFALPILDQSMNEVIAQLRTKLQNSRLTGEKGFQVNDLTSRDY